MRVVIQRVSEASVTIDGQVVGEIGLGLLVLLGIEDCDCEDDVEWLAQKIANMRIFGDEHQLMNRSIGQVIGQILLVSQFTLFAQTKKGNRPGFGRAARSEKAIPLYELMIHKLEQQMGKKPQTGRFGADMKVKLINDGPVTILVDTKDKQ
ncbi:MAG: D-aminoacyl-tRNA deacylase [Sphingobacteriaceae bacterium]